MSSKNESLKKMAESIIGFVGGTSNIKSVTHCVTRVRFVLNDETKVQTEELNHVEGVIKTVFSSGQCQVVVGPIVDGLYSEIVKITGSEAAPAAEENCSEKPKGIKGIAKEALDTLVACFIPSIGVIAGSGMIKVVATLLAAAGVIAADSSSYILLNMIGDAVFYFLPIFVAINAAKKMKVDVMTSVVLAAIIMHPTLLSLGDTGTTVSFFGAGVQVLDYSAQALPVIFGVWLLKYVDQFADRISPNIFKVFLRTMIDLLIVAPIMLIIIGPASTILGNGFMAFCQIMQAWGWLAVALNAVIFPLMVLTGTHNATIPLLVQVMATQGFDAIFLPSGLAANIAEAGAAGAVAVKTKNKKLKGTAWSASLSALLGITEPALYGVNLRLKKPFVGMLLGAFLGGCYIGLVGVIAPTFVSPSLLTIPVFAAASKNFVLAVLSIPVTYAITFAVTYLIGFEDIPE
jgi:PTS system beta-glucosides-specific IIC component